MIKYVKIFVMGILEWIFGAHFLTEVVV